MKILKVDAAYIIESLRLRTEALITTINNEVNRIAEEELVAKQQELDVRVNHAQYVQNLESLVKELTQENAGLAAKVGAKEVVKTMKKRSPKPKVTAPWGLKKDGTPKKRPGRKTGDF